MSVSSLSLVYLSLISITSSQVQELLSMGSLLDYLKRHTLNATRALFSLWITQIIHGMAYMERKRFVHRDLAARNILMQSHSRVTQTSGSFCQSSLRWSRSKYRISVCHVVSTPTITTFNRVTHRFPSPGKCHHKSSAVSILLFPVQVCPRIPRSFEIH